MLVIILNCTQAARGRQTPGMTFASAESPRRNSGLRAKVGLKPTWTFSLALQCLASGGIRGMTLKGRTQKNPYPSPTLAGSYGFFASFGIVHASWERRHNR